MRAAENGGGKRPGEMVIANVKLVEVGEVGNGGGDGAGKVVGVCMEEHQVF